MNVKTSFFEKITKKKLISQTGLIWFTPRERHVDHFRFNLSHWAFYQAFWSELSLHFDFQKYWFYNNWILNIFVSITRPFINIKLAFSRFFSKINFDVTKKSVVNLFTVTSNRLYYDYSDVFIKNKHTPFKKFTMYFFQAEIFTVLFLFLSFISLLFYIILNWIFQFTVIWLLSWIFVILFAFSSWFHVIFGFRRVALDYIYEEKFHFFFVGSFSLISFIWFLQYCIFFLGFSFYTFQVL